MVNRNNSYYMIFAPKLTLAVLVPLVQTKIGTYFGISPLDLLVVLPICCFADSENNFQSYLRNNVGSPLIDATIEWWQARLPLRGQSRGGVSRRRSCGLRAQVGLCASSVSLHDRTLGTLCCLLLRRPCCAQRGAVLYAGWAAHDTGPR